MDHQRNRPRARTTAAPFARRDSHGDWNGALRQLPLDGSDSPGTQPPTSAYRARFAAAIAAGFANGPLMRGRRHGGDDIRGVTRPAQTFGVAGRARRSDGAQGWPRESSRRGGVTGAREISFADGGGRQ